MREVLPFYLLTFNGIELGDPVSGLDLGPPRQESAKSLSLRGFGEAVAI
jgi:hypothetical protein